MASGALMAVRAVVLTTAIGSSRRTPPDVRRSAVPIRLSMRPLRCVSASAEKEEDDAGIMCDPCGGKGWIVCDFCNGEKTNVRSASNRIYRRCPTCKAVGFNLCPRCKVFKCVTFPSAADGEEPTF